MFNEETTTQPIDILNRMIEIGRFNVSDLDGKKLIPSNVYCHDASILNDEFYLAGSEVTAQLISIGGMVQLEEGIVREDVFDLNEVELSEPFSSVPNLPSKLVLRKQDDAVLGVVFAIDNITAYLVPMSNWTSRSQQGFIERNPDHASNPNHPALHYGRSGVGKDAVHTYDFK